MSKQEKVVTLGDVFDGLFDDKSDKDTAREDTVETDESDELDELNELNGLGDYMYDNRSEAEIIQEEKDSAFQAGWYDQSESYEAKAKVFASESSNHLRNFDIYIDKAILEEQYKFGHIERVAESQPVEETQYEDEVLPEDKYADMLNSHLQTKAYK